MARANRYRIPGQIWHITHRCYKKEFLLKFARDRKRWLYWLHESKRRYQLTVLNYTVTSNHIHLLVQDQGHGEIVSSMQLIAGRTAQEYNQRKKRKGAYWEDRYHATAIESGNHLIKCLVYIDLNMVRTGVVTHPSRSAFNGYNEILNPPKRYSLIKRCTLMKLCGINDQNIFRKYYKQLIETELQTNTTKREERWTESLAVGSKEFIENYIQHFDQSKRKIVNTGGIYATREPEYRYNDGFIPKMGTLRGSNRFNWSP